MSTRRRFMMQSGIDTPYIKKGLIFWLDGINKGDESGKWKELIEYGRKKGLTENGMVFDMSNQNEVWNGYKMSGGAAFGNYPLYQYLPITNPEITIEVDFIGNAYSPSSNTFILHGGTRGSIVGDYYVPYLFVNPTFVSLYTKGTSAFGVDIGSTKTDTQTMLSVANFSNRANVVRNGIYNTETIKITGYGDNASNAYLGLRFTGTICGIRIYSRALHLSEQMFNRQVSLERYGL